MMRKMFALLLAVLMVLAIFAGCKQNSEETPSDGQPTPSQGQEEQKPSDGQEDPKPSDGQEDPKPSDGQEDPKPSDGQEDPENLKTPVNTADQDAFAAAVEAKKNLTKEYYIWMETRVPQISMPINAKYREGKKILDALAVMKEAVEDDTLYRSEYYATVDGSALKLEFNYGIYRAKVGVARGWGQENQGGWYTQNINMFGMYLRENQNTETDLLDENTDISDADKEILRKIIAEYFRADYRTPHQDTPCCRYQTVTTDAETRAFEQLFYDMSGSGVEKDLSDNGNAYAIDQDSQYMKCDKADVNESLKMVRDVYNEWAKKYPSIQTYADRYASYVEKLIAG